MSNLSRNHDSAFESIRRNDEQGNEFWDAREFQPVLGYARWGDFKPVIERAKTACVNTGNNATIHFSGACLKTQGRPSENYNLSRYGCYLVAMNGDPRKPEIAAAQSYFAIKTHESERRVDDSNAMLAQLMAQSQLIMAQSQQMIMQIAAITQQQSAQLVAVDNRLTNIESAREEAIASLDKVPTPVVEAEVLTTRAKVNRLVRDYSGATSIEFREVWRRVYREFKDRYHIDLRQRAKNAEAATGRKFTSLDVCEQLGKIEELYAVAFEVLKA
jgi:paraquat-inducible protein B